MVISTFSSHMPMHVLVQPDRNRLVVQSSLKVQVIVTCLLVFGALCLPQSPIIGGVLLFGGALGGLGPPRAVFDLKRKSLYLRRWLRFRTFPLEQIQKIEVLDGGWHFRSRGYGRAYRSFELVLNMDNSYTPRLHLTNHGDQELTRQMASEIAMFLRRPISDETLKLPEEVAKPRHRKKKRKKRR